MFGKTIKTVLGFDATTGLATSVVSSEELSVVNGTIAAVTSQFTNDTVVTGMGRTLALALEVYGTMQLTRNRLGHKFAINPLKAEEAFVG